MTVESSLETVGAATMMACPKCSSVLYEITDGETSQFLCETGHSYSLDDVCPGIEGILGGLLITSIGALLKQ